MRYFSVFQLSVRDCNWSACFTLQAKINALVVEVGKNIKRMTSLTVGGFENGSVNPDQLRGTFTVLFTQI